MTSVDVSLVATLPGHGGSVRAAGFRPDGRVLAVGDADGKVILWDVEDASRPRALATLNLERRWALAARFAPGGDLLAVGSGVTRYVGEYAASYEEGTLGLWDVADPNRPVQLWSTTLGQRLSGMVHAVAFTPDGRSLVTSGVDRSAFVWDVSDPGRSTRIGQLVLSRSWLAGGSYAVDIGPNGRIAAVGSEGRASLWDITDRARPVRTSSVAPRRRLRPTVFAVTFAPDGRLLAHGSGGWMALWDVVDPTRPEPAAVVQAHRRSIATIAFSPDGRLLLSGSRDRTVAVWATGRPPRLLARTSHRRHVDAVAFSPRQPSLFAMVGGGGTAALYTVGAGIPT